MEVAVICARCIEWDLSFVSATTTKNWHSAFAGTITHSSQFACSVYQMRLIVIGDDIAPVCRAASVRCTMEISFGFFCARLPTTRYTSIPYMDLEDEALADAHLTPTQTIVAIVARARPPIRTAAENGRNSITEAFSHFVFGTSETPVVVALDSLCSCRVALLFMWSNLNAWCDSSVKFYPEWAALCEQTLQWWWWVMEKGLQTHTKRSLPLWNLTWWGVFFRFFVLFCFSLRFVPFAGKWLKFYASEIK